MTAPALPASPGPIASSVHWARRHLFRTWLDTLLTLVFGGLALYLLVRLVLFVFVNARWEIIEVNLKLLMVGRWPADELSAVGISVVALGLWAGVLAGVIHGRQLRTGTKVTIPGRRRRVFDLIRRFGLVTVTALLLLALSDSPGPWVMAGAAAVAAVAGRIIGVTIARKRRSRLVGWLLTLFMALTPFLLYFYLSGVVPLAQWEGFFFNISAAVAGIILSFPLGVLLALGRRSKLPLLKTMCIGYIEFVRGSPLFVLLLMANVSLEFFVPSAIAPSKVVRAVVVFTLFTGAYLAEIVRGGLQSVPRGQEEAARALGLTPTRQMALIVLPQALRNVIPAQIGQFISLFKDTTLAGLALGILDLLAAAQAITQQPAYRGQGLIIETLVFVGFLFWVGSYTMSRESQRLERRLGVGSR